MSQNCVLHWATALLLIYLKVPNGRRFCGGSSPGSLLPHNIIRARTQSALLPKSKNTLQDILLVMSDRAPPHCSTATRTTPLDSNLPNISHPILNALQQASDSGLCSTLLIIINIFYLYSVANPAL